MTGNGVVRRGPSPADPAPPSTPMDKECHGCGERKSPGCWFRVYGDTRRGDALGVEPGDVVKICPECEDRLRRILEVGKEPKEVAV